MAVVKLANSRNAVGAIKYLLETKSHDGIHPRVGAVSTQNMSVSGAKWEAVETLKRFDKHTGRHIQARLLIQSFSTDELDPDSQDDLDKANQIGLETANHLYGSTRQILVVTQADNGKVHNHIVTVSPDLITGKSVRGKAATVGAVRSVSDEIIAQHGVRNKNTENQLERKNQRTMGEVKRAEEGLYVWKDDLRERILETLADEDVRSREIFIERMKERGVEAVYRGKSVSYRFTDQEGKSRTSRAKKLGSDYDVESVDTKLRLSLIHI